MKSTLLVLSVMVLLAVPADARVNAWARHWMKPMDRSETPSADLSLTVRIRTTAGEYEPACFAVRSDRNEEIVVSYADPVDGRLLPGGWIDIKCVVPMEDTLKPKRLYDFFEPVVLEKDITRFFWLTLHPPADTKPGQYHGLLELKSATGSINLAVVCEILPFRLEKSPVKAGAFMCLVDLPDGWYKDMKEHGLDAIQFFTWEWGIRGRETLGQSRSWALDAMEIINVDGKLVIDFRIMDDIMEDLGAAGMQGPVVISLGNDHHLFYEVAIAEQFGLPIDTSEAIGGKRVIAPPVSPQLDRLFLEGLRQIRDHWEEKDYPQELVVLIYDEPTERLLERCKNRYDLLKTVMPDYRVYGVVMNKREYSLSMIDQMDIIVCNGDFPGNRDVAEEYGKGYWVYGFPLRSIASSRYDMGCMPWRLDAEGVFFWQYNYWFYSPDYCAVYRHPTNPSKLVSSANWEAIREGTDDLRYFATAEKLLKSAPTGKKERLREKLDKIKLSLKPGRFRQAYPEGETHDEMTVLEDYLIPQAIRDQVIEVILEIVK